FAGPVTYPANADLREAVIATPVELLLAETDAPYLTPHPYRGRPNAPYLVPHTIRMLADLKGLAVAELCDALVRNSEQVYGPW
ncbi:MAG: TatD family hydrolase, partial [Promicromonosporaceae bacterium]|nr:TatD family hydrolase [Promicromonosporaceae bacterium]